MKMTTFRPGRTLVGSALLAAVYSGILVLHAWWNANLYYGLGGFAATGLAGFLLFFLVSQVLLHWLEERNLRGAAEDRRLSETQFFWGCFAALLVLWLPYLIMCAPGNIYRDASTAILYIQGDPEGANNPYFISLLFWAVHRIGVLAGDIDRVICLFLLMLVLGYAALLARSLVLLHRTRIGKYGLGILLLMYGLFPFFPVYAFCLGKDTVFGLAVLAFCLELYELLDTTDPVTPARRVRFLVIAVLVAISRNAALPIVAVTILGLALADQKFREIPFRVCVILVAAAISLMPRFLGLQPSQTTENLSLMYQATGYYMSHYEATEEEKAAIDGVLPLEFLSDYDPLISDPLKEHVNPDATAEQWAAYRSTWLQQFRKQPMAYAKALYYMNYAYFTPNTRGCPDKAHICVGTTQMSQEKRDLLFPRGTILNQSYWHKMLAVDPIDQAFCSSPVLGIFQTIGFYTWMLLAALAYCWITRKGDRAVALLPLVCILAGCCFSPVNGYFRYAFPFILSTPVMAALTVFDKN